MPALPRVPRCHGPRILTGYTLNGYELAILENEQLRVAVNIGRGSHIPEFTYKPKDLDLLFKPPRGHRHHGSFIPSAYDEKAYFEHHAGGWFECFPSGGPPADYHNGRLGFHGELWGQPFEVVELAESPERCALTVRALTHRTPFEVVKTFALRKDEAALSIDERVTNLGAEDLDVLWGQHPTLGAPFLNPECVLECSATSYFAGDEDPPLRRKWPAEVAGENLARSRPKTARKTKMLYLTDFAAGRARVVSPPWKLAFELAWDAARFPYLWVCENDGTLGMPWYGRSYFLAVEPFTGMGNALKEGHGVLRIKAGATIETGFQGRVVEL